MQIHRAVRRTLGAALALGLVAAAAAPALARPGWHGGGKHHGPSLDRLERKVERLDLDPATRESVYQVLDAARAERRAARSEMRAAHERLRELLEQETPDEAAVLGQAEAVGALETAAHQRSLRTLLQVRSLLPAEQWQELRDMRRGHRCGGPHQAETSRPRP